jgi:hypothetical protein
VPTVLFSIIELLSLDIPPNSSCPSEAKLVFFKLLLVLGAFKNSVQCILLLFVV